MRISAASLKRMVDSGDTNGLLQVCRKVAETHTLSQPVGAPSMVAALLVPEMVSLEQETFWVLALDARLHLIKKYMLYQGNVSSTNIRVAEVFKEAVRLNASSIVVAHNHPSGDPTPSPEDIAITRAMVDAGRLLDIEVHDHLVIAGANYVSLKERGWGFS